MLLTFQEAAAVIGQRSRSCVYRWLNDGWLEREGYLRGEPGRWRIESEPGDGIRPFRQWALTALGPQGPIRQSELEPDVDLEIDGSLQFWMKYGRIADPADPPLSGAEFWEHVAAMLGGMVPDVQLSGVMTAEVFYQLSELIADVQAGARWDTKRWDCASARSLLDDGVSSSSIPELQALADRGHLPDGLQSEVQQALMELAAAAAVGKEVAGLVPREP